ncbi:MAG: type III-A CRISPR-associated CARF protein Csm6 [Bacilli bacterium]
MKILFSFVGMTDPISNCRDGAILHIVRHNHIDKAYLYYSKDAIDRDPNNIIDEALKELNPKIQVIRIERPDLTKPNEEGIIDDDIEKTLKDIIDKYPESEVILNITSGTPQMIASLELISVHIHHPFIYMKVNKNIKESTHKDDNKEMFKVTTGKEVLEYSYDGEIDSPNRCEVSKLPNLIRFSTISIFNTMLDSYNYLGAKTIVEKYHPNIFGKETKALVDKVYFKSILNYKKAFQIPTKIEFFPIKRKETSKIYEYILYLSIRDELGLATDFARAISPIFVELTDMVIKKEFNDSIFNYASKKQRNLIDVEKLEEKYSNIKNHLDKKNEYISFRNAKGLFEYLIKEDKEKFSFYSKKLDSFLDFERKIRNKSSHEIVGFSEDKIKKEFNISVKAILKNIKEVFEYCNKDIQKQIKWDLYEEINIYIKNKTKGE